MVAPLAGARIEIVWIGWKRTCGDVAPLAGARIEIIKEETTSDFPASLPSRERGLKSEAV